MRSNALLNHEPQTVVRAGRLLFGTATARSNALLNREPPPGVRNALLNREPSTRVRAGRLFGTATALPRGDTRPRGSMQRALRLSEGPLRHNGGSEEELQGAAQQGTANWISGGALIGP